MLSSESIIDMIYEDTKEFPIFPCKCTKSLGNGLTAGVMVESVPLRVSRVLVGCVDLVSEEDKVRAGV